MARDRRVQFDGCLTPAEDDTFPISASYRAADPEADAEACALAGRGSWHRVLLRGFNRVALASRRLTPSASQPPYVLVDPACMPLNRTIVFDFRVVEEPALSEDERDLLPWGVKAAIDDFIEQELRAGAELSTWKAIDAGCVVELGCEGLTDGMLELVFVAHWELGACAAYHWYRLGIAAAWAQVSQAFREKRCELTSSPATLAEVLAKPRHVLVTIGDDIVAVDASGNVVKTDGVTNTPTAHDEERIARAATTRRCDCGLCLALRASG